MGKLQCSGQIEVIRCKDCKYISIIGSPPFMGFACNNRKGLKDLIDENDYCSYGEKKDET